MWKIMNILFGWDYIVWKNAADQGIARVHKDHNGIWYWRYRTTSLIDYINDPKTVHWLTCAPEKYFIFGVIK